MNLESIEIAYLWAVLGGVLYFAVGSLWYSPLLFTDRWLAAQGRTRDADGGGAMPDPLMQIGRAHV